MNNSYTIKLNDKNQCMSVRCDFYQTCNINSVNSRYKTNQKFIPLVNRQDQCYSFDSGKRSELKDNNYPNLLKEFVTTNL